MKNYIYCAGAIRGDTKYKEYFKTIVEIIKQTDFIPYYEEAFGESGNDDNFLYARDVGWIDNSKYLVAEVSGASTGVGFEISYALFKCKIPVLCLYNKEVKKISAMINGCNSELITVKSYNNETDLKEILLDFLKTQSK